MRPVKSLTDDYVSQCPTDPQSGGSAQLGNSGQSHYETSQYCVLGWSSENSTWGLLATYKTEPLLRCGCL